MIVSPTQIETFDDRTTWGCQLKWFLTYVMKIRGGQDAAMATGEAVHSTIEQFLKTGEPGVLHKIARPGLAMLQEMRPRIVLIEHKIEPGELNMGGAQVVGRLDAMAMGEVIDWKTTSSIAKWAKTKGQLLDSVQMTVYAAWAKENTDLMMEPGARYTLGYFQTKGEGALPVSVEVSGEKYRANTNSIVATIEEMVKVSSLKVENVTPDTSKCHLGFGCPHRAICPRFGTHSEGKSLMASLFESFGVVAPSPAQPSPSTAVVDAKAVAAVLPPDAPVSDPALAALPPKVLMPIPPVPGTVPAPTAPQVTIETPAPIPGVTEKKKAGRPAGSKNKPQITDEAAPVSEAVKAPAAPKDREVAPFKVTEITLRHGARISLGRNTFSSIDVEVEMKAEIFGDPDVAREALSVFVKQGMAKELAVGYQLTIPAPEKAP